MAQNVPIGSSQLSLVALNERSREIFRQIVDSYLATIWRKISRERSLRATRLGWLDPIGTFCATTVPG